MKQTKTCTALLALALAVCLVLAGCTPPAPPAPSATATPAPSATATPAPATPAPEEWDETGLHAALELCVCFGQGEAGVSLKTVVAACGMLDWAEDNPENPLDRTITRSVEDWLGEKDLETRERFWENWPSITRQAQEILDDPDGSADLLASAGDPQKHSCYTQASYTRLCGCISACEDC